MKTTKTKKTALALLLIVTVSTAKAQQPVEFYALINEISTNNMTLAAARKQLSADRMENQSAMKLDDPTIDYGFQWGSPEYVENRHVVTVMQPFDFSLLSGNRRRVAEAGNNVLDAEYQASCISLLIEASGYYVDACLYRELDTLYQKYVNLAKRIAVNAAREFETGETGLLQYNKSKLLLSNIEAELAYNRIAYQEAVDALLLLNGGKELSVSYVDTLPLVLPSNFEEWYAASTEYIPDVRLAALGVDLCREQLSERRTDALPGLAVGYSGEMAADANYHGFQIGLSIPLWSSGLKIKQAKARLESASIQKEETMMKLHLSLKTAYERAQSFLHVYLTSNEILENLSYSRPVERAFAAGEISMLEYSVEIEYLLAAMESCKTALRDYNKAAASLLLMMGTYTPETK